MANEMDQNMIIPVFHHKLRLEPDLANLAVMMAKARHARQLDTLFTPSLIVAQEAYFGVWSEGSLGV